MSTVPAGPEPGALGTSLVSTEELRFYMGNPTWTEAQTAVAQMMLSGVQAELERYINRTLTPIHVRETVQCDVMGYINLRYSPVRSIIAVTAVDLDVLPFTVGSVELLPLTEVEGIDRTEDSTVSPVGSPILVPGGFYHGYPGAWFVVEYTAGWTGNLDDVKLDILRITAREFGQGQTDTINFRDDQATESTPSDTRQNGWTPEELKKYDRLRRRVIA